MNNKIIVANWKMNPQTIKEAVQLAKESDVEGLIICPPFPFLEEVGKIIKNAKLGAQDLFWESSGAYTGEVSAKELENLGVEYVIIGHSERRQNLGETDEMVAKKIETAVKEGLTPILCVGETRAERENDKTQEVVGRELKIGLSLIKNLKFKIENLIVAYEPIWAIGTGTSDTPENMIEMTKFIRSQLLNVSRQMSDVGCQILYGGSVTGENAKEFLCHKEINGALVGGASLRGEQIKKIVEIAVVCS